LSLEDAPRLVEGYVVHYNNVRLNSAIGYLTPKDMLAGRQQEIQAERDRKLDAARKQRKNRRAQDCSSDCWCPALTKSTAFSSRGADQPTAPTGLLDGRTVTTHWRFADDLATRFPRLKVRANSLYLKDAPFYTSAGITAGIDLSLALIEEDFGSHIALDVARELVVYLKRSGGQEQYSAPLRFQSRAQDRLANVAAWIANNLDENLSLERLADKANVCPRHFARLFRQSFGRSPGDFVEKLRLDEARRLLGERGSRVDDVASGVGFKSTDAFRRAFERRLGLSPSQYRGRFRKNDKRVRTSAF
jgi:AraC-like DNA-binding protein